MRVSRLEGQSDLNIGAAASCGSFSERRKCPRQRLQCVGAINRLRVGSTGDHILMRQLINDAHKVQAEGQGEAGGPELVSVRKSSGET